MNGFRDVWDRIIALQKQHWKLRKGPKETRSKRSRRQAEIDKELTRLMYSPEELAYMKENQSNKGYHYLGSGKTYARIGEAFAKGMLELMKNR